MSSGSERSKPLGGSERPAKELALGAGSGTMRIRPENSAGDAGKENRASKAISTRLCSKGKAWPQMGVDWKVPRGRNREDKGPWPLCGSDGGRSMGETARTLTSPERAGRAASSLAHKFQGIRFKRVPSSATQEMEGLNRPDNNRTNWNTSDYGIRELRSERSYPGSTAEVSRRQGTLAVAERGKPSSVGLERDLQDGCGGFDRPGNSAGSLVTPKEAKTRAKRTMTKEQVRLALSVLDLREQDHFSACSFGRDAARRNSCAAMGKG